MTIKLHSLGFPRIGRQRELKKAVEKYWRKEIGEIELQTEAHKIKAENWSIQEELDLIPVNDFSFYDQVLDMSCLLGVVPKRFRNEGASELENYFAIARGNKASCAAEMTKWFDTNYHYIVPEIDSETEFQISSDKLFDEVAELKSSKAKPVLIGPVTYLSLAKGDETLAEPLALLNKILPVYRQILSELHDLGVEWVQFDEPVFATDLSIEQKQALLEAYQELSREEPNIILTNYFGSLDENIELFFKTKASAYHIDAIAGAGELNRAVELLPEEAVLSLGVVDGRNVWKNDYEQTLKVVTPIAKALKDRLWLAPTCSLLHSPYSLKEESKIDGEIKAWLAFAEEKVTELQDLKALLDETAKSESILTENKIALRQKAIHPALNKVAVRSAQQNLKTTDFNRNSVFTVRKESQRQKLQLPPLPTTTIGSFPQTKEVRLNRSNFKKGLISEAEHDAFIEEEIRSTIQLQEEIGLDVLVHGESERNDMVEYFGEQLNGFVFTQYAWVQSYGSRCVKPPIIYGDVDRPQPMTVKWSSFAKSVSKNKVMKGMLTGPVTILKWSFVRNDIPSSEVAQQIALAIRDEVIDLETAGIEVIQVDEPALREGLPLKDSAKRDYLNWAIDAFRLSTAAVKDETQIHTHMCYSDFNEIIEEIAAMDADVISIEASRANHKLLKVFKEFKYPNEIGPGVYDIHSPRVPELEEFSDNIKSLVDHIPLDQLWINPDCGLKTRGWPEVKASLANMLGAVKELRASLLELPV